MIIDKPPAVWVKRIWGAAALCLLMVANGALVFAQDDSDEVVTSTSPREMTADEREINSVLQEIFWRAKANDNSVFYEYEFSYLRKEITLDKYVTGIRFMRVPRPNSDSVVVLTLDSAVVAGDTARAFMTLTVDGGKGILPRYMSSLQYLFRDNGRWIKPLSTNIFENAAFNQRMDDYERDAEKESEG
jgi:hypothetical protein